jgi:hypothetical protein
MMVAAVELRNLRVNDK